ncbi:tetratricopeptide repeat protein [Mesorhizobium sp. RCC_202]|uniref:tetratricopeptide repeat protein n=1 Tax=Mesorhizobium sp. RCC_202 TaxID=3239222 RepID=UPI003524E0CC
MSRRTGALARAFVAWLPRGPLAVLAAMLVLGGLSAPASAVVRDYALCFGDEKSAGDDKAATTGHRIAACTVIAEDVTETSFLRAKAYFSRALARDDKEDWDGAIADYGQGIALDPKRASAYFNRGTDWFNKGEDDRAIADFTATIALEPSAGDAFAGRGSAFLRQGKIDAAIVDYQQAIRADPKDGGAHAGLGTAWNKKGEHDKAIAEYDEAIALDPTNLLALIGRGFARAKKGELDRAIADYDAAIGVNPESAVAYATRSGAWLDKKDWVRAIADANKAIALDAGNTDAYYYRGVAWANKGNNDRAIADFDQAIALDANDATALIGRSLTRARNGDAAGAATDCRKAIAFDPTKTGACETGQVEAGAESANKAAKELAPPSLNEALKATANRVRSKSAAIHIQEGLKQQISGDVPGAIGSFSYAISLDPDNAEAYYDRAQAAASQGDYDLAAKDCRRAAELDPRRADACAALMASQQTVQAAGTADQASATLDPSNAATWYIEQALQDQQEGDVPGAVYLFSYAIKLDPDNAVAYFNRALAEASQGHNYLAASDCRRAVELDPQYAGACAPLTAGKQTVAVIGARDRAAAKVLLERAETRLAKYSLDGALQDFDRAIALDPESAYAYLGRSLARTFNGDKAGADADCRRAGELDPKLVCDSPAAGDSGRPAPPSDARHPKPATAASKPQAVRPNLAATQDTLAAKSLEAKDPRALQAILGGDAWLDMGKYDKAIGAYDQAIALDPDNRFGYFGRGRASAAKGDYGQAIADFDRVIQLAPNFAAAYFGRGLAKVTSGDADGALADCERAATLDPKAREAHYCKGMAWHAKGDAGRAIAAYSVAIAIDAKDDASYYARGMARADRKDYAGATADFDQALKLDAGNRDYAIARKAASAAGAELGPEAATAKRQNGGIDDTSGPEAVAALLERGDAFYKKRKYARAIAEYSRAVTLAPTEPTAYSARALARLQSGQYDGAVADYSQALELDPDYVEAYSGRAFALVKKREPEKAIADLDRAIAMKPDHAPYYFGRGSAWYYIGDFDRAVADLDRAIELDPKFDIARQSRKLAVAAKEKSSRSTDRKKARSLKSN